MKKSFDIYELNWTELDNDTVVQLLRLLEKTRTSLINHIKRGGTSKSSRGFELTQRYEKLKDLLEYSPNNVWKKYCDIFHYDYKHNAYDFFCMK